MAENKTKPTDVDALAHIAALPNENQRRFCEKLLELMRKITKEQPKMWGPTIIGFGSYHYRYESGREGEICRAGFAARNKSEVVVYLAGLDEAPAETMMALGSHRTGKSCLYLRKLDTIDMTILEKLIRNSLAEIKRKYG